MNAVATSTSRLLLPSGVRDISIWEDAWTRTIGYPVRWGSGVSGGFGHGVELHSPRRGEVLAFVEGFQWLHEPGAAAHIIVPTDPQMNRILRAAKIAQVDLVAFVVEALAAVLITHQLEGTVGPISLWVNG